MLAKPGAIASQATCSLVSGRAHCGSSPVPVDRSITRTPRSLQTRSPVESQRAPLQVVCRRASADRRSSALAASGGGGSAGLSGGGSGGDGGGDGDGAPDSGGSEWDARRVWTLVYALLLLAGGAYGYFKKGSQKSLIASGAVAACLLAAVVQMGPYKQAGLGVALVTSSALAAAMGYRCYRSRKFMPSGLVALISLGSAGWYANWP